MHPYLHFGGRQARTYDSCMHEIHSVHDLNREENSQDRYAS